MEDNCLKFLWKDMLATQIKNINKDYDDSAEELPKQGATGDKT